MGSKSLNPIVKAFATKNYSDSKADLFAMFVERIMNVVLKGGFIGLMTPFTWMFLSSYEKLRKYILDNSTITSLIRPEYHAFFDSAYVPICSFTLYSEALTKYQGTFIDLNDFYGAELQPVKALEAIQNPDCGYLYYAKSADFAKIPGSAIAYWASKKVLNVFTGKYLKSMVEIKSGIMTGDDERFLKSWFEIDFTNIAFGICKYDDMPIYIRWYPLSKGEEYRKWYGNLSHVINLLNNVYDIRHQKKNYRIKRYRAIL